MIKHLSSIEKINSQLLKNKEVELFIKRDDLIHPIISGNKYRKLKYTIQYLKEHKINTAITFGGAYSNHIHAASYAFKNSGIQLICIIRGEELAHKPLNKTLSFAKENGAQLIFVDRAEYRMRNEKSYISELENYFKGFVIPEGGSNHLSKYGLKELVDEINFQTNTPDVIVTATGTGGTIAGIAYGAMYNQLVLGFNSVKGNSIDIENFIRSESNHKNFNIIEGYEFGGYGKYNDKLLHFINEFKSEHGIQLEQVYTGKMMYGLFDLIKNDYFKKGTKICAVHTGGLQGLNPNISN